MADIFDEIELPQSAPSAESTGGGGDIFDKVVQSNPDLPEIARITRTEGLRSELTKRMQDMKMFPSFTAAATGAADKNIRRNAEGKWDLPVMTLQSDSGFANFAKGLGTTLGQKTGDRLRNQLIGDEANQIRSVFENFQKDNNLSDDEVQTVWSDLVNRYRRFEDNEILRVQSDGSIEPNPMSSGILDTEKATKAINESGASDVAKRAMIAQLPQLQEAVAENKAKAIEAYAEGDDSFRTWLARRSVDVATGGATFLPRLLDGDRPEFERSGDIVADVKAFEKIIEQEPALREKLRAVENDLGYQGLGKLGQQFAGLAGMVGSERAAEAAGKMGERMALAAQGGEDLGLLGDVLKGVPSVAVQALVTRGAGAAAGGLPSATAARGVTAMTAYATAGLQSAGLTFADEYQAALNEGATEGEAMSVASTKAARAGLSTALITSAFGTGKIGGVESAAAGRAAAEMTLRDLATMAGEKGIRETVKSAGFRQFAKGTMLDVVGEVTEEGIDQLTEAFINADPDTNLADAWDQAIEAGLVGGVIGGVVNVTRSALQRGQAAQLAIEAQKKGASEAAAAAMETAVSPEPAVSPEGETVTEAPEAAETVTEAPNASPAGVSPATGAVVTSALQTPLNIYRATLPDGSSRIVYGESEQDALNRFGVQGATTKLVTADAKGGSVDSARSIVVLSEQAKIDGVDLTKMTREQYVDYAKKNGRYLDGDAIRMRADLRVQDSVADAVDAKAMRSQNESLRFKASKAYDDMTTRLKVVRNAAVDVGRTITKGYINALDHADGWVNFGIKGDPSKSSQQTGKATKAYFGFGDGFISAITEVNLKELLSRLHAAGYNGQLKIGEGSLQMSRLGDQMVAHGKTDADTQIAAQVIEGFFAEQSSAAGTPNPLVDVNFGRDGKTSYSELLSEQTKQASLATPAAQTARQPAAPPTEGAGQVTAEALQRVADNTATPEDVAPLVEQGLVEQIDGQNVITEAGVAQMETPPRLTPEERRGEIAGGVAVSPVRVYHGSPKGPPEGGLRPSKADDFPLLGSSVSTDRGVAERYAQDVDFRQGGATNPIVSEFDFSGNVVDVSDLRKQWESRGGAWEDASSEQITRFALEQGYDAVDLASAGMGEPGELFILRTENLSAPQPQTPATTETPIPQPPATASPQPEAAPTAPLPEGTAPPETGGAGAVRPEPVRDLADPAQMTEEEFLSAEQEKTGGRSTPRMAQITRQAAIRQALANGQPVSSDAFPEAPSGYAKQGDLYVPVAAASADAPFTESGRRDIGGPPKNAADLARIYGDKEAIESAAKKATERFGPPLSESEIKALPDGKQRLAERGFGNSPLAAARRAQGDVARSSLYLGLADLERKGRDIAGRLSSALRAEKTMLLSAAQSPATQPRTPQINEVRQEQGQQVSPEAGQQEVRPQGLQGVENEVRPQGQEVAPETPVPDEGAGAVAPYTVEGLKQTFDLTDEQATVADAIGKALGAQVSGLAKGGTPGTGALEQFAGEKANLPQFMRDSLDTAKAMASAGKSSAEIRAVTGWFPGKYDGKLRWEIPDTGASLYPRSFLELDDSSPTKLADLLNHSALFGAYPGLADVNVVAHPDFSYIGGSITASEEPTITVGRASGDAERALSTLLHEVQHWIQMREGRAFGSDPEEAVWAASESQIESLRREAREAFKTKDAEDAYLRYRDFVNKIKSADLTELNEALSNGNADAAREVIGVPNGAYGLELRLASSSEKLLSIASGMQSDMEARLSKQKESEKVANDGTTEELRQLFLLYPHFAHQLYLRNPGEIEARDVQARAKLTSEQLKATEPYSSENIAAEDAVVLFQSPKGAMEQDARHAELEAKHNAGTITPEETAEAERLVEEAARNATSVTLSDASEVQSEVIRDNSYNAKQVAFYQKQIEDNTGEALLEKIQEARKALDAWREQGLDPADLSVEDLVRGITELKLDAPKTEADVRRNAEVQVEHAEKNLAFYKGKLQKTEGLPTETRFKTGEPTRVKVYHATPFGKIESFDPDALGSFTGAPSATKAHFFAGDATEAQTYFADPSYLLHHKGFLKLSGEQAKELIDYLREEYGSEDNATDTQVEDAALYLFDDIDSYDTTPYENVLHEVYVTLRNPLVVDYRGTGYREISYFEHLQAAKEAGHDGVVFANTTDPGPGAMFDNPFPTPINVVAVLSGNETQIKSADPFTGVPLDQRFDPTAPSILRQGPKGAMEVTETGKILLRGLQSPDFTTAVHELSHAARRTMDALLTPEEMTTVEQWAGAEKGWTRQAEERWARGWERYFTDGKAPLQKLQAVFDKIASWMRDVYANIQNSPIDVEITPEVRAIFDKLASRMEAPTDGQDIGQTPPETPPTDKIPTEPPPLPAEAAPTAPLPEGTAPPETGGAEVVVSPEQDASYLSAVESGDTRAAQEAVDSAAESVGADVKTPLYRGRQRFAPRFRGKAVYLVKYPDEAKTYAEEYGGPEGVVTKAYPKFKKTATEEDVRRVAEKNRISFTDEAFPVAYLDVNTKLREALIAEGYDSATGRDALPDDQGDISVYVSLAPDENLVIADSVVRDDQGNVVPLSERFPSTEATQPQTPQADEAQESQQGQGRQQEVRPQGLQGGETEVQEAVAPETPVPDEGAGAVSPEVAAQEEVTRILSQGTEGRPIRVFHGGDADFTFTEDTGRSEYSREKDFGDGVPYFTARENWAFQYAAFGDESTDYDAIPEGRAMHAADITMQAPLVVSFYQDSNIANTPQWAKLREELASAGVDEQSLQLVEQNNRFRDYRQATAILATPFGGWTEARAAFKRAGYDGIIAEFGPQGDSTIQVIPFNASSVKLAPEGQDIGQTPPETPPTDKIPTEPPPLPGGRQMPQEGDTYGVKKAKLNEARARMGQPPLESNSFGSREDAMARAFETLERDPDAAKKLASRTQGEVDRGGKNAITAYTGDEWAVVNIYKAQQEVALADKTREWFNENASGNRQVADELWGDIEQQEEALREFISRISLAGSKAGADFRAMQDTLLEDFSLEGLTRNYRKQVKNGEPLTKEETATLAEAAETLEREQNTLNLMTLADEMEKAGRTKEAAALVKVAELIDSLQKEVAAERKRPISASKRRDIKKRLSTAAENAKKRLEAAGVYNLGVTPQPESPLQSARVLKDMATVMGAKLADKLIDGTISLQEFTLDLIETFGEKVRPFSERIYEETKKLGDSLRSPGAEPVTPEQIIDSIDRESDLDRKDVWALAKAHVAQGKTGSKVMDAVLSDLKPLFPDLTREQVVQEFTDYGVIQKPNPEPTAKELRRIKQLELEYMKLLDIERGELPKRTGRQRDETDADVRQARKETREKLRALEDKMREAGIEVPSDAQRQKTALQSLKRRMDNEIAELEAAIESGKPVVAVTRNGVVMDEDAAETRKRLEETRARYREMFPKKEITREEQIERAMKALDRQIANEEKMLRDGITERTRTQPLVTPELEAKRQHLSDLREQRRALDPKNSPLEQAIRARRAANEKLEQVLKTNDLAVRRRQKVEPDAVLQELIETGDALRAEIRERRKLLPESPSAYKARTQRELQQAEKRLAEVERIIEEGDIAVRKSPSPKATDPAVTKVRNKIKEANKRIAAMRREAMPEEERAMRYAKALDKRTADLERRIREKDFSPLTKKARPINHPIADEARARHLDAVERHSEFIFQKIYERQNFITKVLKNSIDLAFAVPKAVMASGDASGFGKQGLKMLMAHPLVALKAYSKNFYYSHKSANAAAAALRQRENYPLYLKMGLQFKSARDGQRFRDIHEAYQSRLAKKIPVLGKLVGWSENGYTTFLNQIMADAADVFLANAKNVPGSMTEDNLKMIADHINMLSGTSSFRGFEQYGPALGAILWAPKFLFSQFGAIKGVTYSALDATTGFRLGDVVDQKLKKRDSSTRWARKALAADNARMVGGYVAMGLFFKALTALYNELKGEDDDEMEYEPDMRSTDFGKLKIGDTRYDFGGGMLQALVFGARAITGKVKRADGTVENIADTPGFADQTRLDLAWRFARSKLGPSQGMVVNMLQKTDFLGNPYYWESELVGNYVPLPAQELYESYRQGGMSHSLARTALSFHGFTSNRYGDETDARYNSEIGKDIMDNVLFPVINFAATPTGKRIRPNRYDLPPEAKAWIDR